MVWALDLDGVIWRGAAPIAGSVAAVQRLQAAGHDVLYVTNNASIPPELVEDKLQSIGLDAEGAVVTSAQAAATLVTPDERALAVGGPGVRAALRAAGVEVVDEPPADVVVVGYDPDFDMERLRRATRALHDGARLVATNDDPTYPSATGIDPGGGALVAAVATAGGIDPVVAGKPYAPMAELVRRRFGSQGTMVGDRPSTDGRFAEALGFDFALVLSGVTNAADLPVEPEPAVVGSDLAEVVAVWA